MAMIQDNEEHTEENYFVSMTDMMVGLLFLFTIMLMAFALNYKKAETASDTQKDTLSQSLIDIQRAIKKIDEKVQAISEADQERVQLLKDLQNRLAERGVEIQIDEENGLLRLPENVLFDFDKSELSVAGRSKVAILARTLQEVLPCHVANRPASGLSCLDNGRTIESLFIEGHTDKIEKVPDANWRISVSRAVSTYREMVRAAPSLESFRNQQGQPILSVSGYAANRPVSDGVRPQDLAKNRRIDLRIIMDVSHEAELHDIQDQLKAIILRQ